MFSKIKPQKRNYTVLDEDNLDELSRLTGISQNELQIMLEKCRLFDSKEVFWQELNKWFSIRISGQILRNVPLNDVMDYVLSRSHR